MPRLISARVTQTAGGGVTARRRRPRTRHCSVIGAAASSAQRASSGVRGDSRAAAVPGLATAGGPLFRAVADGAHRVDSADGADRADGAIPTLTMLSRRTVHAPAVGVAVFMSPAVMFSSGHGLRVGRIMLAQLNGPESPCVTIELSQCSNLPGVAVRQFLSPTPL